MSLSLVMVLQAGPSGEVAWRSFSWLTGLLDAAASERLGERSTKLLDLLINVRSRVNPWFSWMKRFLFLFLFFC